MKKKIYFLISSFIQIECWNLNDAPVFSERGKALRAAAHQPAVQQPAEQRRAPVSADHGNFHLSLTSRSILFSCQSGGACGTIQESKETEVPL